MSKRSKTIKMTAWCLACATGFTIAARLFLDSTPIAVAHAGGAYKGNVYTNSIEALSNNYKKGFRRFELDLLIDSEKNIICGYRDKRITKKRTETTPCTGNSLTKWLLARTDALIITDTKGSTSQLYEALSELPEPVKEQIIIQVYDEIDYKAAKDVGFKRLYLSFYKHPEKEDQNIALLRRKPEHLEAVVIPHRQILTTGTKVRQLVDKRTAIYIHTINDIKTRNRIEKKYNHGIYTDSLSP